jgi:hypothetical protein
VAHFGYSDKAANSITAAPLQHRPFKQLLLDVETEYFNLIPHMEARWFTITEVLQHFLNLTDEVKAYLKSKTEVVAFLANVTKKLTV